MQYNLCVRLLHQSLHQDCASGSQDQLIPDYSMKEYSFLESTKSENDLLDLFRALWEGKQGDGSGYGKIVDIAEIEILEFSEENYGDSEGDGYGGGYLENGFHILIGSFRGDGLSWDSDWGDA